MARSATGLRDVAAGVLQQGDEVVGGVAERGALEVEDADAAGAGAVRQPEQVAGEEVAVDEAARAVGERARAWRSRAAAKSSRAAGGAGAAKAAGHHQSSSVPSAAWAMAGASQAGRPGGGAARWMATRTSTAASRGAEG